VEIPSLVIFFPPNLPHPVGEQLFPSLAWANQLEESRQSHPHVAFRGDEQEGGSYRSWHSIQARRSIKNERTARERNRIATNSESMHFLRNLLTFILLEMHFSGKKNVKLLTFFRVFLGKQTASQMDIHTHYVARKAAFFHLSPRTKLIRKTRDTNV